MKNNKGTTFIELLIYIAIFLVLTPILFSVAINSLRTSRQYAVEKQVNSDGQFVAERIYDLIVNAKRINVLSSRLNDSQGKLSLIDQNDAEIIIELNSSTKRIEITEGGVTASLSGAENRVEQLFFEKIPDNINDPEIVLGINLRMKMSGQEAESIEQEYILSGNLENGDFDNDSCPDYIDAFPRHSQCCGDSDEDGICNELDNCILSYNPFQEDYDGDAIGDQCDASAFLEDGGGQGGGGGGAFNCNPSDQLIALINQVPPLPSSTLKQILLSSSPLPPVVLQELINVHPLLTNGHFRQVFIANIKLTDDIRTSLSNMSTLNWFNKAIILTADSFAEFIPWLGDNNETTVYQLNFFSDAPPEESWVNRIKYFNADKPLCTETASQKTDIFVVDVFNGTDQVTVTTETASLTDTNVISVGDLNYIVDNNGLSIELDEKSGNSYAILVSSTNCTEVLDSIEFDFGTNADIYKPIPVDTNFNASRYISYCEGGCDTQCGDAGTGIITTNVFTDRCYRWGDVYPEWCSQWYTFEDDDTENAAFVGGTQIGEDNVYWEKTFKAILTQLQLQNLKSVTVAGEVAYQSMTQFFCDTLESSCPINGSFMGDQNVEMYNYNTQTWDLIGVMGLDDTTSDQQLFEVIYSDTGSILDYFGGDNNSDIKARIQFNWNGVAPPESTSAPSFMLIDFFTLHLKW